MTEAKIETLTELIGKVGFASPIAERKISMRRRHGVELFATLALAVSLVIAATAVSIGMARAQMLHAGSYSPLMPAALIIGHHFSISAFW